jgi:hypothetical protein
MGDDPDRLPSHSGKDDSFHKIPPTPSFSKGDVIILPLIKGGYEKTVPVQRAGRDVGEVLQRYLFTVTIYDEKL